ncbi:hypothetical protein ABH922_002371 [Rhodococcus sp. 27YEA15]|uniref:hypothetical protein n=1 Tax=Rhodococcus sp. 27YEA15 TaxID=3156259 RepID=UPI003C7D9DCA
MTVTRGLDKDEPDLDNGADAVGARHRSWIVRLGTVLFAVVAVCAVLAAVVMGVDRFQAHAVVRADSAAVDAGTAAVTRLISASYTDADVAAQILSQATGVWAQEFEPNASQFEAVLAQSRTQADGEVVTAAVERRDDDGSRTLLIAAVSTVSNVAGAKDEGRMWRLRVTVKEVDGTWKISRIEPIV